MLRSIKEQKVLESSQNFIELREYKVTPEWVKLRLHLLNLQYNL